MPKVNVSELAKSVMAKKGGENRGWGVVLDD